MQKLPFVHHFIETHLEENFSLKELAHIACLSYDRFQHLFSQLHGESVWAYVKRFRLEHAAGFLRHSAYGVAEIGELMGYSTKSAFNKAFEGHFNTSPGNFRRLRQLPIDYQINNLRVEYPLKVGWEGYDSNQILCVENLASCDFYYKRINHHDQQLLMDTIKKWIGSKSEKSMIITSPDILCINQNKGLRIDYGFFTQLTTQPAIKQEWMVKRYNRGKYLVTPYTGPTEHTPLFLYKLIDNGVKMGEMKLKTHQSFLKIIFYPQIKLETWIHIDCR